jgi:hypothetical protein
MDQITPYNLLISPEESAARKAATDYARGSLRLEGFHLPPEAEEITRQYVTGEISLEEHTTALGRLCGLE